MKRGIAYLRVSTELQDIERQKKLIDDYSKKNGIEVVKWIQEKESGYKSNRIGLLELMQCNNDMADIVIVADMSRFSRQDDLIQVVFNIATVLQNGLDLVFINKPDKVYKADQQLSMTDTIMLIVEAYSSAVERTRIVERLTTQKVIMLQKNPYSYFYGHVHFGYRVVDNPDFDKKKVDGRVAKKILVENEDEVQLIKEIYKMYIDGKTMYEITRWLNASNYTFSYDWVRELLGNKIYKGERYYGKETFHIKPIVDSETFNKVQALKKKNRDQAHNHQTAFNPFKGLLRCGHCGGTFMQQLKDERLKDTRSVYICRGKSLVKHKFVKVDKCMSRNIPKQCVWDAMFLTFIDEIGLDFSKHVKPAVKHLKTEIEDKEMALTAIHKRIIKNEKDMEKIARTLLDCDIESLKKRYKQQYLETEKSNKELQGQVIKLESEIAELGLKMDKLNQTSNTTCLTEMEIAEQYKAYIDKVTIYTVDKKKFYLLIHFISGQEFVTLSTFTKYDSWTAKLTNDYKLNPETLTCTRISDNKEFTFIELEDMAKNKKMFVMSGTEKPVKGEGNS